MAGESLTVFADVEGGEFDQLGDGGREEEDVVFAQVELRQIHKREERLKYGRREEGREEEEKEEEKEEEEEEKEEEKEEEEEEEKEEEKEVTIKHPHRLINRLNLSAADAACSQTCL